MFPGLIRALFGAGGRGLARGAARGAVSSADDAARVAARRLPGQLPLFSTPRPSGVVAASDLSLATRRSLPYMVTKTTPGTAAAATTAARTAGPTAPRLPVRQVLKNLPGPLKALGVIGLLGGTGYGLWRGGQQEPTPVEQLDIETLFPARKTAAELAAERDIAARAALDAYAAGGGSYASGLNQGLADYIANMDAYVKAQSPAIEAEYGRLAGQARATGAGTAAEYLGAGRDAQQIYNDLAAQLQGYGAGEGLSTGETEVSDLTGAYGGMAAAPDAAMSQGAALSDYLTREGTIARDLADVIGTSYEAQGAGTVAQMAAAAQAAGARERFNVAQQIAQYEAARQDRLAEMEMQLAMERAQNAQLASVEDQEWARAAVLAEIQAPNLWDAMTSKQKAQFGNNYQTFLTTVKREPAVLSYYGGTPQAG